MVNQRKLLFLKMQNNFMSRLYQSITLELYFSYWTLGRIICLCTSMVRILSYKGVLYYVYVAVGKLENLSQLEISR